MEGLYFEVKPRRDESHNLGSSEKACPILTSNHQSCPSFSHLISSTQCPQKSTHAAERRATWGGNMRELGEEEEEVVKYKLKLIGFRPVHHLTTMAMLPWVVAEISRLATKQPGTGMQIVSLRVSASWVRCVSILGEGIVWDPLTHTVLFECRPHEVTKLIHNSQEPSSFGCLVKKTSDCACYVFQCQDSAKPLQKCGGDARLTTCRSSSVTTG